MNRNWIRGKGRVLLQQGSAVVTCYRHPALPGLFVARDITRPKEAGTHWTVTHASTGLMIAKTQSQMLLKDVKRLALMYLEKVDWTQGVGILSSSTQAKLVATLLNMALGGKWTMKCVIKEEKEFNWQEGAGETP